MDSKISKPKLTGVVKSYRRRTQQTQTQFLKPRTLAAINMNINMNVNVTRSTKLVSKPAAIPKTQIAASSRLRPALAEVPKPQAAKKTAPVVVQSKPKPKLSKWDFKGRLAYAEEELALFKNKLKNAKTRGSELDAELEDLNAREESSKSRAKEAEEAYNKLIVERDALTASTQRQLIVSVALRKEVDGIEVELRTTKRRIDLCKENYENHDSKMLKISEEIVRVETENEEHEETVKELRKHNDELDIALSGIQDKRNEMMETLRILRGDD